MLRIVLLLALGAVRAADAVAPRLEGNITVRTILFPMDDDQLRSSSMQAWSAVGRLVPAIADTARGNCAFSNETVSTLMADVSATLTTDGLLDGNLSAIDDPSVLAAFDDGDVLVTCTIGQATVEAEWVLNASRPRRPAPILVEGEDDDDSALYIAVGLIAALFVIVVAIFLYKRRSYRRRNDEIIRDYSHMLGFEFPKPDEYEFERRHVHYDASNPATALGKGQYGSVVRGDCTVDIKTHGERFASGVAKGMTTVSNAVRRTYSSKRTNHKEDDTEEEDRVPGRRSTRKKKKAGRLFDQGVDIYEAKDGTFRAECAVKLCNAKTLTAEEAKAFLAEAEIMKLFRHPHVLAIIGQIATSHPLLLVTELLESDLKTYMEKAKPQMSPDGSSFVRTVSPRDQIDLCWQAASGLAAIAEQRVVHRDIAARNCLIQGSPLQLKIADFGLSKILPPTDHKLSIVDADDENRSSTYAVYHVHKSGLPLPVRWMAPETLLHMDFYFKSDVWSLGVLMCEIFTYGGIPYPSYNNVEVIECVLGAQRDVQPTDCPDEVYHEIILKCWAQAHTGRPSAAECMTMLDRVRPADTNLTFSKRAWLMPPVVSGVIGAFAKFKRGMSDKSSRGPSPAQSEQPVLAQHSENATAIAAARANAIDSSEQDALDEDNGYVFISATAGENPLANSSPETTPETVPNRTVSFEESVDHEVVPQRAVLRSDSSFSDLICPSDSSASLPRRLTRSESSAPPSSSVASRVARRAVSLPASQSPGATPHHPYVPVAQQDFSPRPLYEPGDVLQPLAENATEPSSYVALSAQSAQPQESPLYPMSAEDTHAVALRILGQGSQAPSVGSIVLADLDEGTQSRSAYSRASAEEVMESSGVDHGDHESPILHGTEEADNQTSVDGLRADANLVTPMPDSTPESADTPPAPTTAWSSNGAENSEVETPERSAPPAERELTDAERYTAWKKAQRKNNGRFSSPTAQVVDLGSPLRDGRRLSSQTFL